MFKQLASMAIPYINICPKANNRHGDVNKYLHSSSCWYKCGGGKNKNMAAVLKKIDEMVIEPRPIPEPRPDEVRLLMDCVGICGSDIHYWKRGVIGPFVLKKPMVIGHEASGIVEKLGKNVKDLKVGDRVALEPGYPCRKCIFCRSGRYNLCPDMIFCATPPFDGNLVNYFTHPSDYCFKLPDHVTMEEGALLEPLSVGCSACRRAQIKPGMNVVIFGTGTIGLCALIAAQTMGVEKILLTDIKKDRLQTAKKFGATHTLLIAKDDLPKCIARNIVELLGDQPERTIDCCGSVQTAQTAVMVTKGGGICTLVGLSDNEVPLPLSHSLAREVDIIGMFRYCNDYPHALKIATSGKFCLRDLVSHHFDIKETEKAFITAHEQKPGTKKVMIHVQERDKNNKHPFDG